MVLKHSKTGVVGRRGSQPELWPAGEECRPGKSTAACPISPPLLQLKTRLQGGQLVESIRLSFLGPRAGQRAEQKEKGKSLFKI